MSPASDPPISVIGHEDVVDGGFPPSTELRESPLVVSDIRRGVGELSVVSEGEKERRTWSSRKKPFADGRKGSSADACKHRPRGCRIEIHRHLVVEDSPTVGMHGKIAAGSSRATGKPMRVDGKRLFGEGNSPAIPTRWSGPNQHAARCEKEVYNDLTCRLGRSNAQEPFHHRHRPTAQRYSTSIPPPFDLE